MKIVLEFGITAEDAKKMSEALARLLEYNLAEDPTQGAITYAADLLDEIAGKLKAQS